MRAPRHYLLLVVYLHSSLKEKRETQISLTNSLFFSSSVLSLFIKKSLFCSSLFSVFLLTIFCEKNANSFSSLLRLPLTCKKNSPPKLRDRQRKKREEKNLQRIDFFRDDDEEITLSKLSLQKNHHPNAGRVYTHTRAHTHTFVSLSRSVNCPSTVVVVVVVSSVCSRPLSLSLS